MDRRSSHTARRRAWPTMRGWGLFLVAAVVLAGAGFSARSDLLFIGLFVAVLPLAALIVVAFDRPRLAVRRALSPDVIAAGQEAEVWLTVQNQAVRPTGALTWRDQAPDAVTVPEAARLRPLAEYGGRRDRGDTARLRYTARTEHRGLYRLGPMVVSVSDPLGLAAGEHVVDGATELTVTPRVTALTGDGGTTSGEGAKRQLLQNSNPSADELIARQYRRGDPLRRVHWPATARRGELMVRQEERSSTPEAWLVIDTGLASPGKRAESDETDAAYETAVDAAASVGVHLLETGYAVSVLETGPARVRGTHGAGRSGTLGSTVPSFDAPGERRAFLTELAGLERTEPKTDYARFLAAALRNSGQRSPVVLVLFDVADDEVAALAGLSSAAFPALALLVGPARAAATELGQAGFSCATMSNPDEIREAWANALNASTAVMADG